MANNHNDPRVTIEGKFFFSFKIDQHQKRPMKINSLICMCVLHTQHTYILASNRYLLPDSLQHGIRFLNLFLHMQYMFSPLPLRMVYLFVTEIEIIIIIQ